MQLIGGANPSEGRVEILVNGEYISMNDAFWTMADGNVVCRQLGFERAIAVYSDETQFGPGSGTVYSFAIGCSGEENSLLDCIFIVNNEEQGVHSKDVGVSCLVGQDGTGGQRKRRTVSEITYDDKSDAKSKQSIEIERKIVTGGESKTTSSERDIYHMPSALHKHGNPNFFLYFSSKHVDLIQL